MSIQITLKQGDCLNLLPLLSDNSIDAVICDLPYGSVACAWDTIIPFEPMWKELKRITKDRAAIVLFGSQPFTSKLIMSNLEMFKYEWIWYKPGTGTGYVNAKNMPMKYHENILVFSGGTVANGSLYKMNYHPQGLIPINVNRKITSKANTYLGARPNQDGLVVKSEFENYPRSIVEFARESKERVHPTQKPVALMEYLIRTYTNEGDTVLDFTMGSGMTGVACARTNRNFIGFELDEKYFAIAQKRINEELEKPVTKPLFSDDSHVNKDIFHADEPLAA